MAVTLTDMLRDYEENTKTFARHMAVLGRIGLKLPPPDTFIFPTPEVPMTPSSPETEKLYAELHQLRNESYVDQAVTQSDGGKYQAIHSTNPDYVPRSQYYRLKIELDAIVAENKILKRRVEIYENAEKTKKANAEAAAKIAVRFKTKPNIQAMKADMLQTRYDSYQKYKAFVDDYFEGIVNTSEPVFIFQGEQIHNVFLDINQASNPARVTPVEPADYYDREFFNCRAMACALHLAEKHLGPKDPHPLYQK